MMPPRLNGDFDNGQEEEDEIRAEFINPSQID